MNGNAGSFIDDARERLSMAMGLADAISATHAIHDEPALTAESTCKIAIALGEILEQADGMLDKAFNEVKECKPESGGEI